MLSLEPDLAIVATGGVPQLDWLDGHEHCMSAWDVLSGARIGGEQVLVYDGTGRHTAVTVAEQLIEQGKRVSMVAIDGSLCEEMAYAERVIWRRRGYETGLEVQFDRRLQRVERDGNRLRATVINELTGAIEHHSVDQVVIEHGTTPADTLYEGLRTHAGNHGVTDIDALLAGRTQPRDDRTRLELHRIGDAVSSRNIHSAVLDALRLCAHA